MHSYFLLIVQAYQSIGSVHLAATIVQARIDGSGKDQATEKRTLRLNTRTCKKCSGLSAAGANQQGIALHTVDGLTLREQCGLKAGHEPDGFTGFEEKHEHEVQADFASRVRSVHGRYPVPEAQGVGAGFARFGLGLADQGSGKYHTKQHQAD